MARKTLPKKSPTQLRKEIKDLQEEIKLKAEIKKLEEQKKKLKGRGVIASALDRAGETFWPD